MDMLDFLRVVLPPEGYGLYCAFDGETKSHVFKEHLEDLIAPLTAMAGKEHDAYFALSTFTEEKRRKAEYAVRIKAFFIDMDGYASIEDAVGSLREFTKATGLRDLGKPYLVASGGGVHAYWPLTHELDIATWEPVAKNLKRLCQQEGLRIDKTVTADAARVLRPIGTFNFKKHDDGTFKYGEPQPVRLLLKGDTFDPDKFASVIAGNLPVEEEYTAQVFKLPGVAPAGATGTAAAMFANQTSSFKKIAIRTIEGTGCAQLAYYMEHATEKVEPLWRGLLTIAHKCEDGWKAAVKLSKLHPYSEAELRAKWDVLDDMGPWRCSTFADNADNNACAGCQHRGKISSPIQLGKEVSTTTEGKEIEVDQPLPEAPPDIPTLRMPDAPYGYSYGENNGAIYYQPPADAKGVSPPPELVLEYPLWVIDIMKVGRDHEVRMGCKHPINGTRDDIVLKAGHIGSKEEALKALRTQGVFASSEAASKRLNAYVVASVAQAALARRPIRVPKHYGWQDDGTFVFAGHVYAKGRQPVRVPTVNLENLEDSCVIKGTMDGWREYMQMIVGKKLYKQLAVFLAGAAAPLMRYTGLSGCAVHCSDKESGTGKTMSLKLVASLWGPPKKYFTNPGTSAVAMQHRLGALHNLPLCVDELTDTQRKDPEWLPAFLLTLTLGKGKDRLETSGKERVNDTSWDTIALLSSNSPAMDMLTGSNGHSTEGEVRRIIEFPMPTVIKWLETERALEDALDENCGHAGAALAQWLVDHEHELGDRVKATLSRLRREFEATDDERFWMATVACAVTIGIILHEAGILSLPLKEIVAEFKKAINDMRALIKGNEVSAEDVLGSFIADNAGQMVTIVGDSSIRSLMDASSSRLGVKLRVETNVTPNFTEFYLHRQAIREYCSARTLSFKKFQADLLAKNYRVVDKTKKDLMAGTRMGRSVPVSVLKIIMPTTEADGLLPAETPVASG